jgi:hypothetical protein
MKTVVVFVLALLAVLVTARGAQCEDCMSYCRTTNPAEKSRCVNSECGRLCSRGLEDEEIKVIKKVSLREKKLKKIMKLFLAMEDVILADQFERTPCDHCKALRGSTYDKCIRQCK